MHTRYCTVIIHVKCQIPSVITNVTQTVKD